MKYNIFVVRTTGTKINKTVYYIISRVRNPYIYYIQGETKIVYSTTHIV